MSNLNREWISVSDTLPEVASGPCAKYYVVRIPGIGVPIVAMFLEDESGEGAWYTNYTSKIVLTVSYWMDVDIESLN